MTADAVGARFRDPERARFIRALVVSVLLHAVVFAIKLGPAPGVRIQSLPGGGTIQAVLRRAPEAISPPLQTAEAGVQTALSIASVAASDIAKIGETATRNAEIATPPPKTAAAPGAREEGRDATPGVAAGDGESSAIPLLPPFISGVQNIPRPAALMAPLNFSYPANLRLQGGRVRVRILLDEKGRIEEMQIAASAPPGIFDHAALQTLRAGRFAPGFIGPMAVRSYLFMEVIFGPGPQGQQIWTAGSALAPPAYRR
jgi:TonB family protein